MMIEPAFNSVATTSSMPSSDTATSPVICTPEPASSESRSTGTLPLTSQTRTWLPGLVASDVDHVVVYATVPRTLNSAVNRPDGTCAPPSTTSAAGVVGVAVSDPGDVDDPRP